MNRTQWIIISLSIIVFMVWTLGRFAALQSDLSAPLNLPANAVVPTPKLSPSIKALVIPALKSYAPLSSDATWGVIPIIDPLKPSPNAITFTPSNGSGSTRICVGAACYDFMGLVGNKALFQDTNLSATKRNIFLSKGSTLKKPLRVKKITANAIVLVDVKKGTTYEFSLFKIDLTPYKPIPKKENK